MINKENTCFDCKYHFMSDCYLECIKHNRINDNQICKDFEQSDKVSDTTEKESNTKEEDIKNILTSYSQIDGSHHKAWCLDQIARII